MQRLLLIASFWLLTGCLTSLSAQEMKLVSGSSGAVIRDEESKTSQVLRLTEEAQAEAIRSVFGSSVLLDEQFEINAAAGTGQVTKRYRRALTGLTGGTWIADAAPPRITETQTEEGETLLRVEVSGYVRPVLSPSVPLISGISSCDDRTHPLRIFREGEPLCFRFAAGEAGYLIIAAEDPAEGKTWFVQSEDGLPLSVKKGKEIWIPDVYSEQYSQNLVLTTVNSVESSRQYIWFIYSKSAMNLPLLNHSKQEPPFTGASLFRKWLYQSILRDSGLQIVFVPISVIPLKGNE